MSHYPATSVFFPITVSHCFKVHGRTTACRSMATGTRCPPCGKEYPSHERLVRHLRTTQRCQETLAASSQWAVPQPYYGSHAVRAGEPEDSMVPWNCTEQACLSPRRAWAMTAACFQVLCWTSPIDWRSVSSGCLDRLTQQVATQPVTGTNYSFLSYEFSAITLDLSPASHHWTLGNTSLSSRSYRYGLSGIDGLLDDLWFVPCMPALRGSPRMLHVLHLFSGVGWCSFRHLIHCSYR